MCYDLESVRSKLVETRASAKDSQGKVLDSRCQRIDEEKTVEQEVDAAFPAYEKAKVACTEATEKATALEYADEAKQLEQHEYAEQNAAVARSENEDLSRFEARVHEVEEARRAFEQERAESRVLAAAVEGRVAQAGEELEA